MRNLFRLQSCVAKDLDVAFDRISPPPVASRRMDSCAHKITEMKAKIESIDIKNYILTKRQGGNTRDIYEDKIEDLLGEFEPNELFNLRYYIKEAAEETHLVARDFVPISENLKALEAARQPLARVRWNLRRMKSVYWDFVLGSNILITIVLIAILFGLWYFFAIGSDVPNPSANVGQVVDRLQTKVSEITETARNASSFATGLTDMVSELAKMFSSFTALLAAAAPAWIGIRKMLFK